MVSLESETKKPVTFATRLYWGVISSIPLSFSLANVLPPEPIIFDFSFQGLVLWKSLCSLLNPETALFTVVDYDGIWSSSIPTLSFLINEDILVECFRRSLSSHDLRISPLTWEYIRPRQSLLIPLGHGPGTATRGNRTKSVTWIIPSRVKNQQKDSRESIPCYSMLYHSRRTPALDTLICSQ